MRPLPDGFRPDRSVPFVVSEWANRRSWPPNHPVSGPPMLGYRDFVHVVLQAIHLRARSNDDR